MNGTVGRWLRGYRQRRHAIEGGKCVVGKNNIERLLLNRRTKLISIADTDHFAVDSFIDEQGFNYLGVARIVFQVEDAEF